MGSKLKLEFNGLEVENLKLKAEFKTQVREFLRIGPYVCAEWNFGGIPVWLKYVPRVSFRTDTGPFKLPDYHEIIENPMDFGTLRRKLDAGLYSNLEQLEAAEEHGMGPSGSTLICGYTNYHRRLESCLEELKKKEVVGYMVGSHKPTHELGPHLCDVASDVVGDVADHVHATWASTFQVETI
ncbi:hypothetical protein AgCh_004374 [Apium graveolens]